MTLTLRADRPHPGGLYEVHATMMPCHEDFPDVRDTRYPTFAIDTGCAVTTTARGYYLGARLERTHRSTLADGRDVPCGTARTHLIFMDGEGGVLALTIAASVNLEGDPSAGGLLGLDLIERLTIDAGGALVTIRDEQLRPAALYPRACACERIIAEDPAGAANAILRFTYPWMQWADPATDAAAAAARNRIARAAATEAP